MQQQRKIEQEKKEREEKQKKDAELFQLLNGLDSKYKE